MPDPVKKPVVIADHGIPFLKGVLETWAEVRYADGAAITRDQLRDADALLVRTRTRCDRNLLEGTPVQFIATATIGFDHIDTEYCDKRGIRWVNAPGCNAGSVQQYLAAVLATLVIQKGWTLKDKTIGIVGVGHVGRKIEALGKAFGMRVLRSDPPRTREEGATGFHSLEQVLQESDLLTLHVPLTADGPDPTLHLMDRPQFGQLRKDAFFINTSRGGVVATGALKSALSAGSLSGAAIDVWEGEPFVDPGLLKLVTIATPHIAGYSVDGKGNGTTVVVRALAERFGIPLSDWSPAALPGPVNTIIRLDSYKDETAETVAARAMLSTYAIMEDDRRFRAAPDAFEALRSQYPPRREFGYFTAGGAAPENQKILSELGFRVTETQ